MCDNKPAQTATAPPPEKGQERDVDDLIFTEPHRRPSDR